MASGKLVTIPLRSQRHQAIYTPCAQLSNTREMRFRRLSDFIRHYTLYKLAYEFTLPHDLASGAPTRMCQRPGGPGGSNCKLHEHLVAAQVFLFSSFSCILSSSSFSRLIITGSTVSSMCDRRATGPRRKFDMRFSIPSSNLASTPRKFDMRFSIPYNNLESTLVLSRNQAIALLHGLVP